MAKVTYASLKLKTDTNVNSFKWEDKEIEVLKYLPIKDKYDLIMITLQKAKQNGFYNPILIDYHFHLNLVYLYTNLTFTDKQREDEMKLYDTLQSSGLLTKILENMEESEYEDLWDKTNEYIDEEMKYTTTTAALVQSIITDLPAQAEAMKNILDSFDPSKYQEVINFAKAANGGREIS